MGMYTGLRFKGIVKEEYLDMLDKIFNLDREWNDFDIEDDNFEEFCSKGRNMFIPFGALAYMPDSWEIDLLDKDGNKIVDFKTVSGHEYYVQTATDGFKTKLDLETRAVSFQCSLKNYEDEIEAFFKVIPMLFESASHIEYFYEEWQCSTLYRLLNGVIELVDDEFRMYG